MSLAAVLVTLAAACVHALWNQLLAHGGTVRLRTAVGMLVGATAFLPFALADPRVEPAAWPFVGASIVLELAYFALLTTAYARAPMGVVYPVARGSAPVLVLLVSALAIGRPVSLPGAVGILLVVAGIVLVRGITGAVRASDLVLALGIGACIAGYTLVDAAGVRHASSAAYIEIVFAAVAVVYTAATARSMRSVRAVLDRRTAAAGLGIVTAYGLVLLALTLAPAPAVAAVRETSVVIALLLLAATGRERVRAPQVAGAVAVCAGVACVVLG
jgi:drug/metabolite transporter (DMT)-like permease